jgi:hypothetical protein
MSLKLCALSFLTLVAAVACGSRNQSSNVGPGPSSQCPQNMAWNGQACVPVQCAPNQSWNGQMCVDNGTQATGGATGMGGATGTGGGGAQPSTGTPTPLDPAAAQASMQGLDLLAKDAAPGAKPVPGTALSGNFHEGQSLQADFQAQPGKCYTLVGAGLPPIQNLDVQIVSPTPLPGFGSPVLAVDKTSAPNAVTGEKPNCFKWALMVPANLRITVTAAAGSGVAAAQLYEK